MDLLGTNWCIFGLILVLAGTNLGIIALVRAIKQLPAQLADKLIEKLREEENRKLFERKSDQKSE